MCLYMKPLTPAIQTLFAELLQQTSAAPAAGSPYRRERDGIVYHYAKIPVATERVDLFIGKAGEPEADAQARAYARGMEAAKERRRLVGLLRKAGLAAPYRLLGATLDACAHAGLFRAGAVVIGTAAYMMMEPLVGHYLPGPTLMTGDLDLATVDLTLAAEPPERLDAILRRADTSFEPVMQLDPRKPPSRFATRNGFQVDLVTSVRRRGDANPMAMRKLAAGAAPLRYIDWLVSEPVQTVALFGAGVLVNVPQPARFAIHKLILAQKRDAATRAKRQKDLAQADALIEALLANDPFAFEDALDEAARRGLRGWAAPINRSLAELRRTTSDRRKLD